MFTKYSALFLFKNLPVSHAIIDWQDYQIIKELFNAIAPNAALNVVPYLRAKAAGLARADCKARKGGSKLRLTACSGTFVTFV